LYSRVGKAFGYPVTVGLVSDVFANGRQVRLAVGVLHMCQEFAALVRQRHAAPQEITGGAPLSRVDIGLREHAAAQQDSNLLRVDLVMFGLAALDGLHVEGMTEDERDLFVGAEVGEPVPGEHAFDRHDDIGPVRSNGSEEGFRVRLHIAMDQDLAALVEDADVPHPGMQVDTAVKWVLRVVKSH
jgi:hypothetical protein